MRLRRYGSLHIALAFVFTCSSPMAQDDASPADADQAEAEASSDAPESRAGYRQRLEEGLEQLNALIADTPSRYHHDRAEVLFRLGRFEESVRDYDAAARFGWPHDDDSCWERGLAHYYAGDYRGGAEQFARYHRVRSLDIENGLWRFLCIAETESIAKARETMLDYPRRLRKPFPALLALYMGRGNADAVLEEAERDTSSAEERTTNLFYAHYYLGKYYDIVEQRDRALAHLREALTHRIPHFMYACAQIDAERLAANPKPKPTLE